MHLNLELTELWLRSKLEAQLPAPYLEALLFATNPQVTRLKPFMESLERNGTKDTDIVTFNFQGQKKLAITSEDRVNHLLEATQTRTTNIMICNAATLKALYDFTFLRLTNDSQRRVRKEKLESLQNLPDEDLEKILKSESKSFAATMISMFSTFCVSMAVIAIISLYPEFSSTDGKGNGKSPASVALALSPCLLAALLSSRISTFTLSDQKYPLLSETRISVLTSQIREGDAYMTPSTHH